MTTLGKTFEKTALLRKELAGIGFELTIGKSEYLDEAASVDTPGDVFPYRFVSVLPDGRMSWEDVNYDRRKESFDVFREEFFQRLAEEYEYRADDKRRAWLALCDDEEAPLPDRRPARWPDMSVWPRPYEGWPRKRRRNDVRHGLVDTAGPGPAPRARRGCISGNCSNPTIRTDSTTSWRTTASCAYARPAIPKSK